MGIKEAVEAPGHGHRGVPDVEILRRAGVHDCHRLALPGRTGGHGGEEVQNVLRAVGQPNQQESAATQTRHPGFGDG